VKRCSKIATVTFSNGWVMLQVYQCMMPCMTRDSIDSAARTLAVARVEHRIIDRLPEACRPASDEDALAIQNRVAEILNEKVGGWKCSTPRGEHIFLAPLLASTIRTGSDYALVPHNGMACIEPEVAFILGKDLTPRTAAYTEADLQEAIAGAHLVLEIIGSRLANPNALPFAEFLADSINNQGLLLGPAVERPFERQLEALTITVSAPSGELISHHGRHPNGHPLRPLLWLANFLSSRGETLKAGFVITTGSYAGVLDVPLQTPLTVAYGDLGKLEVTFEGNG
jgi:2-keto-4-pentenoate hydratase